jgi:putative two-component system response regulator
MQKQVYNILIVDDTKENLNIVQKVLELEGYQTKAVLDGITALSIVNEEDFDLILLDINMPKMNGISVCRYLKIEPHTASIPVIFLTADEDRETLTKAYKAGGSDYIKKPFFKEELIARVETRINIRNNEKNLENIIRQRTKEIYATQVELMYVLGGVAEGHSKETTQHVQRVSQFAYLLAKLSGMQEKAAELLKNAASLHDIGKIAIPSNILHKKEKLTKREFKEIQKHASLGAEMLQHSSLPLFKAAKIVAGEHHEKYDGSGYPNGLKGKDIHIYGRIVAIADVFDALMFKRSYKGDWSVEDTLAYMKDMRAKQFDPDLIDIFFENIDAFLKIYNLHQEKIILDKKYNRKKRGVIMEWLLKKL